MNENGLLEIQSTPDSSESRNSETLDNSELKKKFGVLPIIRKQLTYIEEARRDSGVHAADYE